MHDEEIGRIAHHTEKIAVPRSTGQTRVRLRITNHLGTNSNGHADLLRCFAHGIGKDFEVLAIQRAGLNLWLSVFIIAEVYLVARLPAARIFVPDLPVF